MPDLTVHSNTKAKTSGIIVVAQSSEYRIAMSETKEDYKDCKINEDTGNATKILVTHFADDAKEYVFIFNIVQHCHVLLILVLWTLSDNNLRKKSVFFHRVV